MVDVARRRRFQLHLSTAVALMFAAGGLLWANTAERTEIVRSGPSAEAFEETSESLPGDPIYKCFGWPRTAATQLIGASMSEGQEAYYSISNATQFVRAGVVFNAGIGFLILLAVWIVCELWIYVRGRNAERKA